MSDLTDELRARANARHSGEILSPTADLCARAADRLEALEAALKPFAAWIVPMEDQPGKWRFGVRPDLEDYKAAYTTLASQVTEKGAPQP